MAYMPAETLCNTTPIVRVTDVGDREEFPSVSSVYTSVRSRCPLTSSRRGPGPRGMLVTDSSFPPSSDRVQGSYVIGVSREIVSLRRGVEE